MIKKLWNDKRLREIFLYCVVGGLTTVVNYVVYFLFTRLVGGGGAQSPGLAALILDSSYQDASLAILGTLVAWAVAVAFAFYPNKRWVFKSQGGDTKREILQFLAARVVSLGMDVGLMALLVGACGLNDMLSKLIVQVVVIIANYFASKFWIFKRN
ncbi:MAG TPA: GtrA family protein [Candidatus Pullichristensenella stercorigallinarum]|uniref:GtrA family protein n=1 Tax=Candidatus Pullichristensenella stercorigallinarum TaxID=2840909 RepID=A0A9D0ZKD4_9FIRM|nr:GtrA family protein [Candidatus Pullichristensenella stercorigallinarum]